MSKRKKKKISVDKEDKLKEEQKKSIFDRILNFSRKLNKYNGLIAIVSILLSGGAFFISYKVAFGGSDLELQYRNRNTQNFFCYEPENNTILYEFIMKNKGYGSTIYGIEPIPCPPKETGFCLSDVTTPIVKIRYNDESDFRDIKHFDYKSIGPKTTYLANVAIENVPEEYVQDKIYVGVWNEETGITKDLVFYKSDKDCHEYI